MTTRIDETETAVGPSHLKLSDAMEAGWQHLDQLTNGVFTSYENDKVVAVCALGAACYAAGERKYYFDYEDYFPQAATPLTETQRRDVEAQNGFHKVPYSGVRWDPESVLSVADAVIVMNDTLKLPKQEIIETIRRWGY
jgi:hypothetical protein